MYRAVGEAWWNVRGKVQGQVWERLEAFASLSVNRRAVSELTGISGRVNSRDYMLAIKQQIDREL